MLKLLRKHIIEGIIWGFIMLALNLFVIRIITPDDLPQFFENFFANSIPLILSVMGFVTTLIIFEIERLHLAFKLIIHALTALTIQLIVGFSFGIYTDETLHAIPTDLLSNIVILLVVWTLYYFEEKREIAKINKRLLEKNLEQPSDIE